MILCFERTFLCQAVSLRSRGEGVRNREHGIWEKEWGEIICAFILTPHTLHLIPNTLNILP